jgi:hypothetical protein
MDIIIYNIVKIYDDGETRNGAYRKIIISTTIPKVIIDYIKDKSPDWVT